MRTPPEDVALLEVEGAPVITKIEAATLECLECGYVAVERPIGEPWQMDEDVTCPHCGTKYIVNLDEEGTDVWLARVEEP